MENRKKGKAENRDGRESGDEDIFQHVIKFLISVGLHFQVLVFDLYKFLNDVYFSFVFIRDLVVLEAYCIIRNQLKDIGLSSE